MSDLHSAWIVPFSMIFRGTVCRMLLVFSSCSWGKTPLSLWLLEEDSESALQLNWSSMAWTMGTIMAVVAVLLIHMERKAVTPMNPSINLTDKKEQDIAKDVMTLVSETGWFSSFVQSEPSVCCKETR